jgi:hypothetical protein
MSIQLGDTLKKAKALITEDRQAIYGDPRYVYQTTAEFWHAYLKARGWAFVQGKELSAQDVAMMMALLKAAREAHRHNPDNMLDMAGYADLAAYLRRTDRQ